MRERILIAGTPTKAPATSAFQGWEHQETTEAYIGGIVKAGGVPLMAPILSDLTAVKEQLDGIDGLLIPGGADINPLRYHAIADPLCHPWNDKLDAYETALVKEATVRHIPIFGICRGMQLINVVFGGTLWQDWRLRDPQGMDHAHLDDPTQPFHRVYFPQTSFLKGLFPTDSVVTNSLHHQLVKDVAPGFVVSATASDGAIEAIECVHEAIFAVQWHPEAMLMADNGMLPIWHYFLAECGINRA